MTGRRSLTSHGNRSNADAMLAARLAAGDTVAVAAATAGMSHRTAHRRLKDPGFRELLDDLRADYLSQAGSALAKAATASVEKLVLLADRATAESLQPRVHRRGRAGLAGQSRRW